MWAWRSEWALIKAALPELESFFFSGEIYWPLSFARDDQLPQGFNPRLSAGRLMIAIHLLKFYAREDAGIAELISADLERVEHLLRDWKSNWTNKALKEYAARLRQWKNIIQEIRAHNLSPSEYSNQVQVRLIIGLLRESAGTNLDPALSQELAIYDQILTNNSTDSAFIWDVQLKNVFPEERFWYLYRRLNR